MICALVQVEANFPFPSLIDIEHLGRRKEVQDKFLESMCTGNEDNFSCSVRRACVDGYMCVFTLQV